jgi:hypothetical protein
MMDRFRRNMRRLIVNRIFAMSDKEENVENVNWTKSV